MGIIGPKKNDLPTKCPARYTVHEINFEAETDESYNFRFNQSQAGRAENHRCQLL
jgi:hypothetical protein